jgi:Domain of unknown function (DUF6398)/Plasmid pRiA4b ORF-3-like protein
MAKAKQSEDVPKAMEEKYNSIVALTNEFARQYLNEEYAQLIRQATAKLCRKRPSPLEKGQAKTWAGGITHAIGMVNFLYDSSQTPHVSVNKLYEWFGIAPGTGQTKSKLVRDTLKIRQFDPDWSLASLVEGNPLTWMLSVNGLLIDIRKAPIGAQMEAYRRGFIPYIPAFKNNPEAMATIDEALELSKGRSASKTPKSKSKPTSTTRKQSTQPPTPEALQSVYVLEVLLIDGPLTDKFIKKNPQVIRLIEIRGDQTLADLHRIIFKAFNRKEEHLYEFQLKGDKPNDPNADRYGLAMDMEDDLEDDITGDVEETLIGSLNLEVDEFFGYWFDFGDSWWHRIEVTAIQLPEPKVKYPRITQRVGASPPQYAEF